ncbi:MAG TPA: folylpolyglutamate synthase/dihydrofolate synthase family protein [Anaerolineales bacterium]
MPGAGTSYDAALDYLYSFVDYSLKHSSELAKADFNLDRMRLLMAELGNPQDHYPTVHVAGTKGKGSVCAFVASGLHAAGLRVGLYTSPHLLDYAERIRIDFAPIDHRALVDLVEEIKPVAARVPKLTTFEITTALAFMHFAKQHVDAAVIEVGLGGRLDATNIILPKVSVITSLSYDHMAVLGNTLAQIAGEKAGIIKPGVPVISAPQKPEALEVLVRVAAEHKAPFTLVGRDITFEGLRHSLDGQSLKVRKDQDAYMYTIPLLGAHQVQNAAVAAAALWTIREQRIGVPDQAIQDGLAAVQWPARFQVVRREPPVIFDSAHNQDSFARLRQALEDYFPGRPAYLVFGASEDKNIPGMFEEIKPVVRLILISKSFHPRALEPEKIAALADQAGIPHEIAPSVGAAFGRALEMSEKDGSIVLSAGSMFVTAEVMASWKEPDTRANIR